MLDNRVGYKCSSTTAWKTCISPIANIPKTNSRFLTGICSLVIVGIGRAIIMTSTRRLKMAFDRKR